jgi:hypothetical protein
MPLCIGAVHYDYQQVHALTYCSYRLVSYIDNQFAKHFQNQSGNENKGDSIIAVLFLPYLLINLQQ